MFYGFVEPTLISFLFLKARELWLHLEIPFKEEDLAKEQNFK